MNKGITREAAEKALSAHKELQGLVATKYMAEDEKNFSDVLGRIVAMASTSRHLVEDSVFETITHMIEKGCFIPAGSILMGFGVYDEGHHSLSNCYLAKIENDSIESIFDANKKLGRTYSYRGGSGIDITVLRPGGSKVHNAANTSSGAVSFIPLFNETTRCIGQNGRRNN